MYKAIFHALDAMVYAVLSCKLGICWSSVRNGNYGDCEENGYDRIRTMLNEQVRDPVMADTSFVYPNHGPLTHSKWIKMIAEAGFKVIERRILTEIKTFAAAHFPQISVVTPKEFLNISNTK